VNDFDEVIPSGVIKALESQITQLKAQVAYLEDCIAERDAYDAEIEAEAETIERVRRDLQMDWVNSEAKDANTDYATT